MENAKASWWRGWQGASWALWGSVFMIGLLTVGDYGFSWDEEFRFEGGDAKLAYYSDVLAGEKPDAPKSSYPGFFDLPLAWAHDLVPEWGTRSQKGHLWSLSFGLLGLFSTWRLTARIGGERAGFWALLFLVTFPRFYGHMFFNPKDIPLAGTYAFGCWALVSLFSRLPRVTWWSVAWVGLSAGIAMSCRIAGFLILVYFGLFVGLYLIVKQCRMRASLRQIPKELAFWGIQGAVAGLIGFGILFIFWPTLHSNPFSAVAGSVETVENFGWAGVVLMDGHFWEAQDLPFYYLPYWFFRTTPEHVLALLLSGLLLGIYRIYVYLRFQQWPESNVILPRLLLVFSFVFPLAYIAWKDPVLYDGLRHVIFVVPPIAAIAALAFEWCLRLCERKQSKLALAALQCGGLVAVGLVSIKLWQLHPYQYVYFNSISGGLPGAYMRDETDYWGLSHKEAGAWLNAYIRKTDPVEERVYRVYQRYSRWMLEEFLDPQRFEMSQSRVGADFFVSVTRFNLHNSYPEAELLHAVERQGVPLCFIYLLEAGE
ncbi:MAG: hypothetical protein GVY36_15695 [Verrucomicrobia bacterium]|nr:hypothetical protein [Verrucomicrobiota bacterium]